jgi:hypothetical protein
MIYRILRQSGSPAPFGKLANGNEIAFRNLQFVRNENRLSAGSIQTVIKETWDFQSYFQV